MTFVASHKKTILSLLCTAILTGLGLLLLTLDGHSLAAWAVIIMFGFGFTPIILAGLFFPPVLNLTTEGFHIKTAFRSRMYRWSEVSELSSKNIRAGIWVKVKTIAFTFREKRRVIGHMYTIDVHELSEIMNLFRERSLQFDEWLRQ